MNSNRMTRIGAIGAAIAAICCVTPLLVVLLPAMGLAAWLSGLDAVLFPTLGFFLILTAIGMYRARRGAAGKDAEQEAA